MNQTKNERNPKSPTLIEGMIPVCFLGIMLAVLLLLNWCGASTAFAGSGSGKGKTSSTSSSSSSTSGSTTSTSSSSSSTSGSTTSTSSSSSSSSGVTNYTENTYDPNNSVTVDFDGNPGQISGADHNLDGSTNTNSNLPGIGIIEVPGSYVDASGNSGMTGVNATDSKSNDLTSKVEGGMVNTLDPNAWKDLESFIQNAKNSATITLDTSAGGTITTPINNNEWTVVYAKPSDATKEQALHFSGNNGGGKGVLVIEVNDPSKGQLLINAGAQWQGLVIVVQNYRDTANINNGNGTPIDLRGSGNGGGNGGHVLGAGIVYYRNQTPTNGQTGYIFGDTTANLSGGGSLSYSSAALANAVVKSSLLVVSWRKLPSP